MEGSYIPMLDGWRAVAIVLVLLFHGVYNTDITAYPKLQPLAAIAGRTGALGVLVFFSISGYLIPSACWWSRVGEAACSRYVIFYIKRCFRILPPLAVYLLTLFTLRAFGVIHLVRADWSAPMFLADYWHGSWFTTHFWSLSVEEQYYLFWPICIFLLGWRRAFWVGIALVVAVGVWRPWVLLHTAGPGYAALALQRADMRMDYIVMGALVALAVEFYPATIQILRRLGSTWAFSGFIVLLLAATFPAPVDLRSVQALLITLLVCASTMGNATLPRLLLTNRPVLFIGKISYSLYIWQQLFLGRTDHVLWNSLPVLPLKYCIALGTAYASYQRIERPLIRLGRKMLKGRVSDEFNRASTSSLSTG